MLRRTVAGFLGLPILSLLLLAGCDTVDSPVSPSSETLTLESITSSASANAVPGLLRTTSAPSPSGGPVIAVVGNQTVVNGGTMVATVNAVSRFNTIYVLVGARSAALAAEAQGGIGGHYEIRLPTTETSVPVLLTFPQSIPLTEFELLFAVADPSGAVGPFTALATTVTPVGTGDVQVTLSWDVDSDVDLHVVEPNGEELYYGRPRSGSGGELDLDSNAGCVIDHVRNENITWPIGRAPRGSYSVRVDYWDSCGVPRTNFTVRINSGTVQIVSGFFTGLGDHGVAGSGRIVATFERLIGPTAVNFSDPLGFRTPWGRLLHKGEKMPAAGR